MFPGMSVAGWSSTVYSPMIVTVPGMENAEAQIAQQWIRIDNDYKSKVEAAHGSWYPLGLPSDTGIRAEAIRIEGETELALKYTQDDVKTKILSYVFFMLPRIVINNPTLYANVNVPYGTLQPALYPLTTTPNGLIIDGEQTAKEAKVPAIPIVAVYGQMN